MATEGTQRWCNECGNVLLEDSLNAESILVCKECGWFESLSQFTIDDSVGMQHSSNSYHLPVDSYLTSSQKKRCSIKPDKNTLKLRTLKTAIKRLASELKLSKHVAKVVEEKASVVVATYSSVYNYEAIAAGVIYLSDPSHQSVKRLLDALPASVSKKVLNATIKKLKQSLDLKLSHVAPSFSASSCADQEKEEEETTVEDMISDKLNLIDRCVKKEERTGAISFATKLWRLLEYSRQHCHKLSMSHHSLIAYAIIAIVLSHLRRSALKDADISEIAGQLGVDKRSFKNIIQKVAKALVLLAELVPSLKPVTRQSDVQKHPITITRHLSTLLENVSVIVIGIKSSSQQPTPSNQLDPDDGSLLLSGSCAPVHDDDEDTLSDVDVDQYIASEAEVELKKLLQSPQ